MRRRSRRLLVLLGVAVLAASAGLLLRSAGALTKLELAAFDLRMNLRPDRPPPRDIVIVGIDERTFAELDERWPLRRTHYAQLLDKLHGAHARLVALDLQ